MLAAAALPRWAVAGDPADAGRGNYMGSGRACYGMLTITRQRITWMTPFSLCRGSRYAVRDRRDGPNGLRITYELEEPSPQCRYRVLVLTHDATADAAIGWNAVGYPSLESAARESKDEALGCYLYR